MSDTSLRKSVEALGFTTRERTHDGYDGWHGWRKMPPGLPKCETNEKPPDLHVEFFDYSGSLPDSCQFQVCAELPGDLAWVDFKLYAIPADRLIASIPVAERVLGEAWRAAVEKAPDA